MKTILFTDPANFEQTEQQFEEFHYDLGELIEEFLRDNVGHLDISDTTRLISNQEGDKLMIGVMKKRKEGQITSEKYRITIEKIKNHD